MSYRVKYVYWLDGASMAGEDRHPQVVIREWFPDASDFVPQSVAAQWHFTATERKDLPNYFSVRL